MFSSQAINPTYANVYASFDAIWSEAGVIVAGNSAETDPSGLIVMGAGALMPFKITDERGLWLMGGQNCTTAKDFSADAPFSIAILTDCPITAAGWLAATFDSSTNLGVRFGASAAGTLVATLQNAGGSIVQTATNAVKPSQEKRLYVLTYDGSGLASGLKLHVDGVTCTSVSSGTSVSGSLSSGRALSFGSQWNGATPSTFALGRLYAVAVYPFVLDSAMRSMLRETMRRDVHAEYPARYAETPAWTPALLPQPGDSWLWADLDAAGAVTLHTQPVPDDWDMEAADAARWSAAAAGGVVTKSAVDPYAGSLCMRIDVTGNGQGYYQTNKQIHECRSLVSAALQSDGIVTGGVLISGAVPIQISSNSLTWQMLHGEGVASAGNRPFLQSVGAGIGYFRVDSLAIKNLSVKKVVCKGNLGDVEQATPANMPWSSDPDATTSAPVNGKRVMYGERNADHTISGNLNFLHDGSGGTWASVYDPSDDQILYLSASTDVNVGVIIRIVPANTLRVYVANGSGAGFSFDVTSAALPAGKTPVIYRLSAGAYSVRVGGVEVLSGAPGALAAGNSSLAPRAYAMPKGGSGPFTISRYITDAECELLEEYLRDYYDL